MMNLHGAMIQLAELKLYTQMFNQSSTSLSLHTALLLNQPLQGRATAPRIC